MEVKKVNIVKSKVMILRKVGKLERNLLFKYGDTELEIV